MTYSCLEFAIFSSVSALPHLIHSAEEICGSVEADFPFLFDKILLISCFCFCLQTVSLAALAAFFVSIAVSITLAKVSSSSFILNNAFSTASLLMTQINLVLMALSKGSPIDGKSQVTASWHIRVAISWLVSFWFSVHIAPELKTLAHNKTFWVELF